MSHHKLSLLIIDDNPRLVKDYASFFEDNAFTVYTAKDGPEGISHAKQHHPSVILLDLMLPEMNGIKTLKNLKHSDETKEIPVIVITALVEDQQKEASLNAGALDYIAKVDVTPEELLKKVMHAATHTN